MLNSLPFFLLTVLNGPSSDSKSTTTIINKLLDRDSAAIHTYSTLCVYTVYCMFSTNLFQLSNQSVWIHRPRPGHPMQFLLLLPVEGVQERPVLGRQVSELGGQRVHQVATWQGDLHRHPGILLVLLSVVYYVATLSLIIVVSRTTCSCVFTYSYCCFWIKFQLMFS